MRKTVVDCATGKVVNAIEINQGTVWSPPTGCVLMDGGNIGDTWNGTIFVHPETPSPTPVRDLATEVDALKVKVAALEAKSGLSV